MTAEKHKSQRSATANTVECRIAFPFVHKMRTKNAGGRDLQKPRRDAVVLMPKLNPDPSKCANYAWLSAHCMEAAGKAWPGAGWPQGGKWPIQDGDVPYQSKPQPGKAALTPEQLIERNKWRAGHWVVEVTNFLDPGPRVAVVQNGAIVEIPSQTVNGITMYKSGDYGIVALCAYSFQNETFGVNFGFEGILFTRPGEAIGSSGPRSAAQMFGGVAGTVAPPAHGALPPVGAAPAPGYAPPPAMPAAPAAPPVPVAYAAPPAAAYAPPAAPPQPPAPPLTPPPAGPLPPAPGGAPPMPPFPAR